MSTPDQDRATMLSRLRAALGVKGADDVREAAVADRLKCHPRGTIPARASQSPEARIAFLEEMLATQGAEVTRAKTRRLRSAPSPTRSAAMTCPPSSAWATIRC